MGKYMDRSSMMRSSSYLAWASMVVLVSCTASVPPTPVVPLPISVRASSLSLRADIRELTPQSANLVVRLFTTFVLANVSVTVHSVDSHLHIAPPRCFFRSLSPPTVHHVNRPPYPLPLVPFCSVVLRARDGGQYPLTLRVRNAAGSDLIAPVHTVVVIQGGSS